MAEASRLHLQMADHQYPDPMTDPNGAAIYGAPWISTKTPVMLA